MSDGWMVQITTEGVEREMLNSLALSALGVVGLAGLVFGIFTGLSHGWQVDIVNTVTIAASIVVIVSATFVKRLEGEVRMLSHNISKREGVLLKSTEMEAH